MPLFVDWNAFRPVFEREAEKVLGQPVHVDGTASVRLLPMPAVAFTRVRVGGSAGQPMLSVDRFSARIELIPLITGDVKVADMQIEGPKLAVTIDDEGRVDWLQRSAGLEGARSRCRHAAERHGQERRHQLSRQPLRPRCSPSTALTQRSMRARFSGRGRSRAGRCWTGGRPRSSSPPGRRENDGRAARQARCRARRSRDHGERRGRCCLEDARGLVWTGTFGLAEVVPANEDEAASRSPAGGAGGFELRPDLLRLPELTLAEGPEDRPFSLTGAATIALGAEMRFDAVPKSRQVDLDRSIGQGPNEPVNVNAAGAALVTAIASPPRPPIPGRIGFDVPGIVVGGSVVQNLQFDVATDGEDWRIADLAAELPGPDQAAGRTATSRRRRRCASSAACGSRRSSRRSSPVGGAAGRLARGCRCSPSTWRASSTSRRSRSMSPA